MEGDALNERFVRCALGNTDARIAEGKPVTPAFLFAALLWPAVADLYAMHLSNGMPPYQAIQLAGQAVLEQQQSRTAIPRRFSLPMREIWELHNKLIQTRRPGVERLLDKPRFRAAYDFVLLRQQAGEDLNDAADWWTRFQTDDIDERQRMIDEVKQQAPRKRKKKNTRSRNNH
ncbi:hypothetical protein GYB62_02250 [bacterium]|nr:hypothetical protein [bacterium]